MDEQSRIDALELRITGLERQVADATLSTSEQLSAHNKMHRRTADYINAVQDMQASVERLIQATNGEADDVWFILDQLIKEFKLKVPPKKPKDPPRPW